MCVSRAKFAREDERYCVSCARTIIAILSSLPLPQLRSVTARNSKPRAIVYTIPARKSRVCNNNFSRARARALVNAALNCVRGSRRDSQPINYARFEARLKLLPLPLPVDHSGSRFSPFPKSFTLPSRQNGRHPGPISTRRGRGRGRDNEYDCWIRADVS